MPDVGKGQLRKLLVPHSLIRDCKAEKERVEAGGELDTLLEDLEGKPMSEEEATLMAELVEEHKLGRKLTGELVAAKEAYVAGDRSQASVVLDRFGRLIDFYPQHIAKEDCHFFPDTERHYSKDQLDKMLADFYDFDMQMIHEKYKNDATAWEGERPHRR